MKIFLLIRRIPVIILLLSVLSPAIAQDVQVDPSPAVSRLRVKSLARDAIIRRQRTGDSSDIMTMKDVVLLQKSENPFFAASYKIPLELICYGAPVSWHVKSGGDVIKLEYAIRCNSIQGYWFMFQRTAAGFALTRIQYFKHLKNGQEWICRIRFRTSGKSLKTVTLLKGTADDCKTLGELPPDEKAYLEQSAD